MDLYTLVQIWETDSPDIKQKSVVDEAKDREKRPSPPSGFLPKNESDSAHQSLEGKHNSSRAYLQQKWQKPS